MKSMIDKVMAECNCLKASSVAFPALGTGALGFPQDVAAKIMVQATHQYLQGNSNTSVKKVIFVIYQDEVLNAFQRELTTLTPVPAVPSGPTRAQPLPPMQPMQSSLSQHAVSPKWAPEISSHHNQILVKKGPLTDSQVCFFYFKHDADINTLCIVSILLATGNSEFSPYILKQILHFKYVRFPPQSIYILAPFSNCP